MGLALGDIEKLFRDHGHIEYSGEGVTRSQKLAAAEGLGWSGPESGRVCADVGRPRLA